MIEIDETVYATPIAPQLGPNHKGRKKIIAVREVKICLRCPLDECHSTAAECTIRPVLGLGGDTAKNSSRIKSSRRRAIVNRHGERAIKLMRARGPITCQEIAKKINMPAGSAYTLISSMMLDFGIKIL